MTAPAWMPLYVSDYLADTGHLSTLEHGAYMLLIMHYWQNGALPTEDAKLARIARLSMRHWLEVKETICGLFSDDWHHKRIDTELSKTEEVINKRSAAGKIAGRASAASRQRNTQRSLNDHPNDQTTIVERSTQRSSTPSPSPSPKKEKDAADAATQASEEADLFRRGKQLLGKESGGLIAKLLKAKDRSIPLARAALEQAATKQNPREYIGAIIRGRDPPPDEQRWDPRL